MGRIVETFWSCKYCGTGDIRGRYRECPGCGRPRGDVTFEVKNPTANYVSEEEARNIQKEPDWFCEYCDSLNSASDSICKGCGASRLESGKSYFDIQKEKKSSESSPPPETVKPVETVEPVEPMETVEPAEIVETAETVEHPREKGHDNGRVRQKRKRTLAELAVSLAFVLVIAVSIGALAWLLRPKADTLVVTGVGWERSISIEKVKIVEEDGWSLPSGARLKTSRQELYGYERVLDHYETVTEVKTRQVLDHYEEYVSGYRDLGNGYAEEITSKRPVYKTETYTDTSRKPVYRNAPVYKTKYYYEVEKWEFERSVDTKGNDHEPYFGEYRLKSGERKGEETSTYYIIAVNSKGREKRYTLSYSDWTNVNEGETLSVVVHIFGKIKIRNAEGKEYSAE